MPKEEAIETKEPETSWLERLAMGVFTAFSILAGLGFGWAFVRLWIPSLGHWENSVQTHPSLNLVGDALGPFASLFSGLALIAAFMTLHMQRQELREQRADLRATRQVMIEQTALLRLQSKAAEAQAQAGRSQAAVAEAACIINYLDQVERLIARLLAATDSGQMTIFSDSVVIPRLPLCENKALDTAFRSAHERLLIAIQSISGSSPLVNLREELVSVYSEYQRGGTLVHAWYQAKVRGVTLTEDLLKQAGLEPGLPAANRSNYQ